MKFEKLKKFYVQEIVLPWTTSAHLVIYIKQKFIYIYIMPKRYRRKKYYKKSKSTKAVAYKALKIAKSVKSVIETKFLDTTFTNVAVDSGGTALTVLNNPSQGLTDSERIGDQIKCTSLRWRFNYKSISSNAAGVRLIIIWDKFSTVTAVTDVLAQTGSVLALVSDYKHDKRQDYIVLHDYMYSVDQVRWRDHIGQKRIRINKKTQFTGGSINIEKGALKVFAITDDSAAQPPNPNADIYFRLFYQDA